MAHKTGFTKAARKLVGWAGVVAASLCSTPAATRAQQPAPTVYDTNLAVRAVVSGLNQPIGIAFLGPDSYFIIEKASGQVKWVRPVGGVQTTTVVLDLPVNSNSERGLLSVALHPNFPTNPGVYLFWTESSTGSDSAVAAEVGNASSPYPPGTPNPFGSRIDRFVWNGSSLAFAQNLLVIRSFQADPTQPLRGNHNGGVIKFAQEGGRARLYVVMGDQGRRGQLQNLEFGAPADPILHPNFPDDDQFGGPEPDQAHLSGVVLRLNDDGSAPADNPFFNYGRELINGGNAAVGTQLQKVFAYGVRNSFGLDIDPASGDVWIQENGDDSFSELNRVVAGQNGGWVQIAGPVSRIAEFKAIESGTFFLSPGKYAGMQQVRYPATLLADTPDQVLSRLYMLPGATYHDPDFSWRFEIAPGGIGFLRSRNLGPQYENDLFMGAAVPAMEGGYLFRFNLTGNRRKIGVDDPRIEDRVADNLEKHNFAPPGGTAGDLGIIESESFRFGRDFGIGTDIRTGPNGNLFVVSLSRNTVYEVYRPSKH
jgi:glucose/arabinose dehydrogenase